jgi:hypothetical protein
VILVVALASSRKERPPLAHALYETRVSRAAI